MSKYIPPKPPAPIDPPDWVKSDDYMPFDKYVCEQLGAARFIREPFPLEVESMDWMAAHLHAGGAWCVWPDKGVKSICVEMLGKGTRTRRPMVLDENTVFNAKGHPSSQLGLFLECGFAPWWGALDDDDKFLIYEGPFPEPEAPSE